MKHDKKACPLCGEGIEKICGEGIEKTARGGRRKYSCQKCGASINKLLICDRCGTRRVWQGKKGAACSGCGAPFTGGLSKHRHIDVSQGRIVVVPAELSALGRVGWDSEQFAIGLASLEEAFGVRCQLGISFRSAVKQDFQ